jgi:hypothetical protein
VQVSAINTNRRAVNMEYIDPNIDYKELLKELLTRLKAHEEAESDLYGMNACDSALDYLFYLEDKSK